MKFALALMIAVHFWGERGVQVPCHPVAVSGADALLAHDRFGNPDAMAATSDCRILISSQVPALRYWEPGYYCGFVVHEVGHLAGLQHTPGGVMAEGGLYDDTVPWDCDHWKHFARERGIKVRDARRVP